MFSTFRLLMEYNALRTANYLIYFLQKIPLLGKKISDRWYRSDNKDLIYWIGAFLRLLKNILGKVAYIVIMLGLPTLGYLNMKDQAITPEAFVSYGLFYFVVLNLIGAGFPNPVFMAPRKLIDYELVKLARIDERQFFLIQLINYGLTTSLLLTLGLLAVSLFLPLSPLQALLLGLTHLATRLIYEAISLKLFSRYHWDLYAKDWRTFVAAIFPLLPAYGLPFFISDFSFTGWLFHPIFLIILMAAGLISLRSIIASDAYVELSNAKINLLDIRKRTAEAKNIHLAGGKVRDQDLRLDIPAKKLAGKHDYAYLHQLFFERYAPTFRRSLLWRLGAYLLLFVAGSLAAIIWPDWVRDHFSQIARSLIQVSFYYFYFFGSYGERFTKVLFLNMDFHLLPYSFYREPEAVTKNLGIRFKKLLHLGLMPTLVLAGLFSLWAIIFTGFSHWQTILLVNGVFIVLTLFFSLHHLFIYHTFQPYNRNMEVKSPLIFGINLIIYIITFTFWRTNKLPTSAYLIVMAGMLIYLMIGWQLMKKLAPKNFKMKT